MNKRLYEDIADFADNRVADLVGVARFSNAMKRKLAKKRREGYAGWNDGRCSIARLRGLLTSHLKKRDPVDIANFCMMIWNREHPTGTVRPPARVKYEDREFVTARPALGAHDERKE